MRTRRMLSKKGIHSVSRFFFILFDRRIIFSIKLLQNAFIKRKKYESTEMWKSVLKYPPCSYLSFYHYRDRTYSPVGNNSSATCFFFVTYHVTLFIINA